MEEQMQTHWLNKLWIGKGTLKDFSKDYEMVNAGQFQFATASQLFPTGDKIEQDQDEPCPGQEDMEFEYVIYYKVHPNALKSIDKITGEIKIDMTEKEGKEMDPDMGDDSSTADEMVVI